MTLHLNSITNDSQKAEPLMIVCFAAMQRTVLAMYGLGYKFVIANVKKKVSGTI